MKFRRVAVTGVGVVAPCGIGKDAFWQGLQGPVEDVERRVCDFDPEPYFENSKQVRRTDRYAQFAFAAAHEALEQAGEIDAEPTRRGVFLGTGIGGLTTLEEQIINRYEKGERRVSPFLVPMMMANAAAGGLSMKYGWQGPAENTVTACAAGTHSIGNGARWIATDRCDAVLAGGSEASFTITALAGFRNMTALSANNRSMPFDKDRNGFVMAEGAAVLVLEEWDRAVARGATILAEVMGAASTADAHHITAPSPGGVGAVNCMKLSLDDAGLSAEDIVHINAHGTSTPLNDAAEAEAINKVFGGNATKPIVTSTKGVTGHALGAAGAIEAAAIVLAMEHKLIPPTVGHVNDDPEMPEIDLVVGDARPWTPGPSMSNSFGFGGHNGTLILSPSGL
ncbi:MAG: 3-oxoacyl-[acyl-carrier-protein] synthase II [Verrucomicrobiales bacterium]|jgi:3-oxoacyl-[acyl-carrier-protein] synthase II